jgi:proteasome assembly chaperone (PAC2) family protein
MEILISILPSQSYCCFIRELVNPTAVYSAVEQNRLAKAKLSDKTVFIRTEEEVAALANSTLLLLKLGILNLKNARICLGLLQRHLF